MMRQLGRKIPEIIEGVTVKKLISILSVAVLWVAVPSWAQLSSPNDAGVAMGHLHLNSQDVEASKKFWTELGGTPTNKGPYTIMKFPGVLVFLNLAAPTPSTGGSEGSVVNHVGFNVPNVQASLAKWQAAGLKAVPGNRPQQCWVITPDNLKIEILEDQSQTVPIAMHHIHFWLAETGPGGANAVGEIQAWYTKTFGAKPGKRGPNEAADLPGINLTFTKSSTPVVGTKGRALDHIGFEIKNLEAFCKNLEAQGVKLDRPYGKSETGIGSAFLTDPWGTYIEINEGMNRW
jgi:catechol 2,3-dioxygenase-like lactoylglutathione lyase family enzyme